MKTGDIDPAKILHAIEVVAAMKAEGIYTHFSIYFPLWLDPTPNTPWLKGYNGKQHSFASLMFNPGFQKQYRKWWTALLTTPHPDTGKRLIDDSAADGRIGFRLLWNITSDKSPHDIDNVAFLLETHSRQVKR